jgi:hypothetical protein
MQDAGQDAVDHVTAAAVTPRDYDDRAAGRPTVVAGARAQGPGCIFVAECRDAPCIRIGPAVFSTSACAAPARNEGQRQQADSEQRQRRRFRPLRRSASARGRSVLARGAAGGGGVTSVRLRTATRNVLHDSQMRGAGDRASCACARGTGDASCPRGGRPPAGQRDAQLLRLLRRLPLPAGWPHSPPGARSRLEPFAGTPGAAGEA